MLLAYRLLLLLKLAGVLLFAGGAVAALAGPDRTSRHRATHRIASLGLLLTWVAGYALVEFSGHALTAPWVLGGLLLSLAIHLVLIFTIDRDRRAAPALAVALLFLAALALMLWRPQ